MAKSKRTSRTKVPFFCPFLTLHIIQSLFRLLLYSLPGPWLTSFTTTSCPSPSQPPRSSSSSSAPPSQWFSSASAWRGVRRRRHWVSTTHGRWRSQRCWWPSAASTSSAIYLPLRRWGGLNKQKQHKYESKVVWRVYGLWSKLSSSLFGDPRVM